MSVIFSISVSPFVLLSACLFVCAFTTTEIRKDIREITYSRVFLNFVDIFQCWPQLEKMTDSTLVHEDQPARISSASHIWLSIYGTKSNSKKNLARKFKTKRFCLETFRFSRYIDETQSRNSLLCFWGVSLQMFIHQHLEILVSFFLLQAEYFKKMIIWI